MLKIGLTGGIGSGKTIVAELFSKLNIPVIDADKIAHQLTLPGSDCYKKIVKLMGEDFLTSTGELDRKKIAQEIFNDSGKKKKLEEILHPQVRKIMLEEVEKLEGSPYVILVIPLLFETDFIDYVDRSLVVDAPESVRINRIKQRDGISEELIKNIIDNQLDPAIRREKADDIIDNSKSIEELLPAVKHLHETYVKLSGYS
jgi:dephospho-CoA kinase